MKEKFILIIGILFLSVWIYLYWKDKLPQQYDYNGGLIKKVYAKVVPSSDDVLKEDSKIEWNNSIENVTVSLWEDSVQAPPIKHIYIPPPPRDSH